MTFNPNASQLSEEQIIQQVFDPVHNALNTNATVQVDTINADLTVDIKASSGDNIAITNQDGTNPLKLNPDGSINAGNTLITAPFDYISGAYPSATVEVYTYKNGGPTGSIVGVITVGYTDTTKQFISSVSKA